jgi:LysM repeat protein
MAQAEPLKFAIREEYMDLSAKDLLASPIRVLDGLTPAQSLAFYDAFRITNVIQLAQNRIMLEARIIEYLDKVGAGQLPEADVNKEIASILLTDQLPDVEEARRRMAEGEGEGDLGSLASGLAVHLRERLEALRQRAREKAGEIAAKPTASEEELAEEAGRVRPGLKLDARSRMDAIRESRQRADAMVGASTGARPARESVASLIAQRETTRGEARARRPDTSAIAGRTLARPSGEARAAVTTTTTAGAARPSLAETRKQAEAAEAEARAAQVAAAAEAAQRRKEAAQRAANMRLLLVAAAVVVLLLGGIGVWLSLREEPVQITATQEPAPGEAAPAPGAEPAPGAAEQAAVAPQPPAPAVVEPPPIPIRTTHTVSWGQSLWRIARSYYRNPELWPRIHRANEDTIPDPELIYPRQRVKIPEIQK